jgi:hypothetical protein
MMRHGGQGRCTTISVHELTKKTGADERGVVAYTAAAAGCCWSTIQSPRTGENPNAGGGGGGGGLNALAAAEVATSTSKKEGITRDFR